MAIGAKAGLIGFLTSNVTLILHDHSAARFGLGAQSAPPADLLPEMICAMTMQSHVFRAVQGAAADIATSFWNCGRHWMDACSGVTKAWARWAFMS